MQHKKNEENSSSVDFLFWFSRYFKCRYSINMFPTVYAFDYYRNKDAVILIPYAVNVSYINWILEFFYDLIPMFSIAFFNISVLNIIFCPLKWIYNTVKRSCCTWSLGILECRYLLQLLFKFGYHYKILYKCCRNT